jgi:hypothetical protein
VKNLVDDREGTPHRIFLVNECKPAQSIPVVTMHHVLWFQQPDHQKKSLNPLDLKIY